MDDPSTPPGRGAPGPPGLLRLPPRRHRRAGASQHAPPPRREVDMISSIDSVWAALAASGLIVARFHGDGPGTVDLPTQGRFREPYRRDVHDGRAFFDGVPLHRVAAISPACAAASGWYEAHGRRVLLTSVTDASFGEPLVLLAEADSIVRAYPISDTHLLGEDGSRVDISTDSLCLTRDGTATVLPRSSRLRESAVTFVADGVRLAGTLILPPTPGPHPAAVVVHGAAGGTRDFYRLFAQPLLDADVAVLIYDRRGNGQSDGDPDVTIFDQAAAASAAMDLLAVTPGIDGRRIGLVGFSNGMWAVPMVAARRSDVAFVAGIGSPGLSMAECEVHRRVKVLLDSGIGRETATAAGEAWRLIFSIAASGHATGDVTRHLADTLRELAASDEIKAYQVPSYARHQPMLSPVPPTVDVDQLVKMLARDPQPELTYDPVADYARIRCPIVLQYGSQDTSVPVAASVRAIGDARDGVTFHVYPGLEHVLNVVPT